MSACGGGMVGAVTVSPAMTVSPISVSSCPSCACRAASSLFKKLFAAGSVEEEALQTLMAKKKTEDMRDQLKNIIIRFHGTLLSETA